MCHFFLELMYFLYFRHNNKQNLRIFVSKMCENLKSKLWQKNLSFAIPLYFQLSTGPQEYLVI